MEIDQNLFFLWRSIERFADVLIGALAIFLGYKLFLNLPERPKEEKGEMKMWLPGGISVYASRVGPGVFFALFGTTVVLMSFASPVKIDGTISGSSDPSNNPAQTTSISYATGKIDEYHFSTNRANVQRDLLTLRRLERTLNDSVESGQRPMISESDANTLINALQRIKQSLLLSVWDEAWGDQDEFSRWVQDGGIGTLPAGMENVGEMFRAMPEEVGP